MSQQPDRPEWLAPTEALETWAAERLRGCEALETVRVYDWSAVFSTRYPSGRAFLKAVPPGLRGEVEVTLTLAAHGVGGIAEVLGADSERGWLLTAELPGAIMDAGEQTLEDWRGALTAYAKLQRQTEPLVERLIDAGANDARPSRILELFDSLLVREHMLLSGDEAMSPGELRALTNLRPQVAEWADRLVALRAPLGLIHNDLHDGNICHDGDSFRFFDWGDSFVGPVFADLHLAIRVVRARTGASDDESEDLRRQYLGAWFEDYRVDELLEIASLSGRVACILHAMTWATIADVTGRTEARGVARWCRRLLELNSSGQAAHFGHVPRIP